MSDGTTEVHLQDHDALLQVEVQFSVQQQMQVEVVWLRENNEEVKSTCRQTCSELQNSSTLDYSQET